VDEAGRVVGRKLIGINAEGLLVGFRTYTSLEDAAAREALQAIFQEYAAGFASRSGLTLGASGTVPALFAQAWYDDGIVEWDEAATCAVRKTASRPAPGAEHCPVPR